MYEHKLNFSKLKKEYEDNFNRLEKEALDIKLLGNSNDFKDILMELIALELDKIDLYFGDLFNSYQNPDFIGHKFYEAYHRLFSYETSDKLEEEIDNNTSNVEKALVLYVENGYKIIPFRYLPEDMKSIKRVCNKWGEDCTFPILIDKNIVNNYDNQTISLVNLSTIKFYNSKEDYIGEVLRKNINENIINDKNKEAKNYYIEVVRDLSNSNGNNLDNELNKLQSLSKGKEKILKHE